MSVTFLWLGVAIYIYIIPLGKCGTTMPSLSRCKKKNWGPDWVKMHQCQSISLFLDVKILPPFKWLSPKIAVAPRVSFNHAILPMVSMAMLGVVPYFQTHSQWDHQQILDCQDTKMSIWSVVKGAPWTPTAAQQKKRGKRWLQHF